MFVNGSHSRDFGYWKLIHDIIFGEHRMVTSNNHTNHGHFTQPPCVLVSFKYFKATNIQQNPESTKLYFLLNFSCSCFHRNNPSDVECSQPWMLICNTILFHEVVNIENDIWWTTLSWRIVFSLPCSYILSFRFPMAYPHFHHCVFGGLYWMKFVTYQ